MTIQQLREVSPTFNAALIGYLEATRDDVEEQNRLTPTNTFPNAAADWIRTRHVGMIAQRIWEQTPDVTDWIGRSRLNISAGLFDQVAEPRVAAALGTLFEHRDRAIDNLASLRRSLGDDVTDA